MNGTFLGLVDLYGGDLQFCKASDSILDAAFVFGTTYEREVFDQILYYCAFISVIKGPFAITFTEQCMVLKPCTKY